MSLDNNSPLVSIITPIFNGSRYLSQYYTTINSQTYRNIEIVCIDDCSTDTTLNELKKLQRNDSRIKVIHNRTNKSCGVSKNIGISNATGKYIMFLDIDDFYNDENSIKRFVDVCEKENLDVCRGGLKVIDDGGQVVSIQSKEEKYVSDVNLYNHQKYIWRRDFIVNNEMSFSNRGSSYDDLQMVLQTYIKTNNHIRNIPDIQYVYVEKYHWKNLKLNNVKDFLINIERYLTECKNHNLYGTWFYRHMVDCLLKEYANSIVKYVNDSEVVKLFLKALNAIDFRLDYKNLDFSTIFKCIPEQIFESIDNDVTKISHKAISKVIWKGITVNRKQIKTILIFNDRLDIGGIQRYVHTVASQLSSKYRIVVLYLKGEVEYKFPKNVILVKMHYGNQNISLYQLCFLLKMLNVDCVYNNNLYQWWYSSMLARLCKVMNVYNIMHWHNSVMWAQFPRNEWSQNLINHYKKTDTKSLYDLFIVLSNQSEYFFRKIGYNAVYLTNPIDEKYFSTPIQLGGRKNNYLWCGRLDSQKNPYDGLMAFTHILRRNPESHLYYCAAYTELEQGQVRCYTFIKRFIKSRHLEDKITFVENETNLIPYYEKCNVLLYTSTFDGFPWTVLEALSRGLKISAYDQNEIDILNEECVLKCNKFDFIKLAYNALTLNESTDNQLEHIKQKYDVDICDRFKVVFDNLIDSKRYEFQSNESMEEQLKKTLSEYEEDMFVKKYSNINNHGTDSFDDAIGAREIRQITFLRDEPNYGQKLQCYALQKTLKEMYSQLRCGGKSVNVVAYVNGASRFRIHRYNWDKKKLCDEFVDKYIRTKKISDINDIYNDKFDKIYFGGDQILNYNICCTGDWPEFYYLPKIPSSKKVVFSASMGNFVGRSQILDGLANAPYISTRELGSSEFIRNTYGVNCETVIDPVFLCSRKEWEDISVKPSFITNQDEEFSFAVELYGNWNGYIPYTKDTRKIYHTDTYDDYPIGPSEFLWMISHCKKLYTSSFHAYSFGILFNVPEIHIVEIGQKNLRIREMINLLHIESKDDTIVNWDQISRNIQNEQIKAKNFLLRSTKT